ncbi:hypothetical protein ACIA8G_04500 [Lentzea sp. NPDC051213]|uniref:hypothetical protein n=1 Tax=Lentzea sp. NPDC051213 TaxID=3364126 RepID=UPI0037945647
MTVTSAEAPPIARRGTTVLVSVLAGFALTVLWSASFVDRVIGDNVAGTLLGHDARETPIAGTFAGVVFALVSGLAGTFTACNIAAFGTVGPLLQEEPRGWRATLRPVGWMAAGIVAVSATYGVVAALVGTRMPQFATAASTGGLSPRNIQSMIVYGVIGVAFIYLGLAALGLVRDPLARVSRRFPAAPFVVMGALIGGFLIGRPFALFRMMFRDIAESHNVLYGALAFTLQSLANILVMAVLFLLLAKGFGGRVRSWLLAKPGRAARVTAVSLIVAGTFTLLYWDLRVLGRAGLFWYPTVGW